MADTLIIDDTEKIVWSEIVGVDKTVDDGGFVGDLLTVARAHLTDSKKRGELTAAEAGEVYSAMIPAAFQHAIRYALEEPKVELELESLLADIQLKQDRLALERNKAEAELEKQWGYDVTRDEDDTLVLGDSTGNGKIDLENELLEEKIQTEDLQNKPDGLIESQIEKMQADVDIANEEIKIAISKESKEYTEMIGNLDKVLGYDYDLDAEGNVIRDSITDAGDGKIDKENEDIDANIELKGSQNLEVIAGTTRSDTESDSKVELTNAQITDLSTQKDMDLFRTQMSSWSQLFGGNKIVNTTDPISSASINAIYDKLKI